MATVRRKNIGYGLNEPLVDLAPSPILANRAPTTADRAEIGTLWIDQTGQASYTLVAISGGISTWATTLSATTLASLTVTTGPTDIQAGTTTITSDTDAAQAIYLHADGGTNETIQLHADQGTGNDSVLLVSDVGGVTLTSTARADAAAIDINSGTGGIDMDAALQVNIDSAQAAATALRLVASNAAGGIDIDAGTAGVDLDTTGDVVLTSSAATATALTLEASNAAGGITLDSNGLLIANPGTDTQASPTAASTVNTHLGVITFTGFTTAGAAEQLFTITNDKVSATSGILVSAGNIGGNDAQMTVTRVTPAAGSFTVRVSNEGAAAVDGNILISFFVLN